MKSKPVIPTNGHRASPQSATTSDPHTLEYFVSTGESGEVMYKRAQSSPTYRYLDHVLSSQVKDAL